jgi:hypothetical protein
LLGASAVFLLVHQHAGRNRRDQVVARVDCSREWQVCVFCRAAASVEIELCMPQQRAVSNLPKRRCVEDGDKIFDHDGSL